MNFHWPMPFKSVAIWLVLLVSVIAVIKVAIAYTATLTATTTAADRDPIACEQVVDNTDRLSCYDASLGRVPSNPARGAVIPKL